MPTVHFMKKDNYACGYYRAKMPAKWLIRSGYKATCHQYDFGAVDIKPGDVMVLQRLHEDWAARCVDELHAKGATVVMEMDDNLHLIRPSSPAHKAFDKADLDMLKTVMKKVDMITVTTPALAQDYGVYNDNVKILPNYLDGDLYENIEKPKRDDGKLVIGWAGTATHEDDVAVINGVLKWLGRNYKDRIILKFIGYIPDTVKLMNKANEKRPGTYCEIQGDHYMTTTRDYLTALATFDIALAPVEPNRFNECKSDLRFIENAALGNAVVASKGVCYDTIQDLRTGLLCDNRSPQQWKRALAGLIEKPDILNYIQTQGQDYVVRERFMEANIWRWVEAYGLDPVTS